MPPRNSTLTPVLILAWIHGGFYLLTGAWTLFGIESFQLVTGPKTDLWLVRTVGSLLAGTGGVLLFSAFRRSVPTELAVLALSQNLILATLAAVYVFKGTIPAIYLFDTIVQTTMAIAWIIALWAAHSRVGVESERTAASKPAG